MRSFPALTKQFAWLVAGLICLATAGCGSLIGPSNPPPQIYRLNPQMQSQSVGGATATWQLAVARPDTSQSLDTDRIALLRGPVMDYYADAQWSDSAPRLVQSLLVQAFDSSGRVQAGTRDSSLRGDLTLTSELRDFEARYDGGDAAPTVVVAIEAKLLDSRGQVVASLESRQTAHATQNSVASVVEAFDEAMAAALSQIVGWTLQATRH